MCGCACVHVVHVCVHVCACMCLCDVCVHASFAIHVRSIHPLLSIQCCRDSVLQKVESKLTASVDVNNDIFLIMAASVFFHEKKFDSALRVLNLSQSLEG